MENIKKLLTIPYNQDNFKTFSANFLKEFETVPLIEKTDIPSAFRGTIESYTVFGKYVDAEDNKIIVLSVKVKNNSNAQKAQRQFVSHLLANVFMDYNASMVAYYDEVRKNWKLSFVTIEYSISTKGIELLFKPAKRFSFLVGMDEPSKTYVQQLNPIYISNEKPSLKEINDAFSISRLSDEFYLDYKNKFFELYDYLIKNSEFKKEALRLNYDLDKFATTFCKKTLGQIVFLYFVQKKGWLGVKKIWGDGDKQYLLNSTKNFKGENYFNDFLEPLFYNALNKKRLDDCYLGVKIPFLNGGLFHPINDYNWETTNFNIPNTFWFNNEETGLLNIFSQYNFTVDEADPEEQDLAIDPEMLGKIFESLLDIKDRASLGAFYTPREIVHSMCEQSLATRLSEILNLEYESILNYIRFGDALQNTSLIQEFAEEIDDYVSKFTIVDPAVGSGAFLIGMLNQIVQLRMNLLKYTNKKISKYQIKYDTIQNCLYGVDIEYDAVEIAKLRLWLSLIVDEEASTSSPKPLPNLNFHLRMGNSLNDTYEGIKIWSNRWRGISKEIKCSKDDNLFGSFEDVNLLYKRLSNNKVKYFNTSLDSEKQKLYNLIEKDQISLIKAELWKNERYELLQKIEEMLKNGTKPFFLWELEFYEVFEQGGFDIVVGNPPYGLINKKQNKSDSIVVSESELQHYKTAEEYAPAQGRMLNIYRLFICKSLNLLKKNGALSLIFPMAFLGDLSAVKLRKYIFDNVSIQTIEVFPERDNINKRVFKSAKMSVCILNLIKSKKNKNVFKLRIQDDRFVNEEYPFVDMKVDDLKLMDKKNITIPIVNQNEYNLINKMNTSAKKIGEISKCYTGEIDLSLNKKYYSMIENDTPLLRGAQIQKWFITKKISQGELLYIDKEKYLSENNSDKSKHYQYNRIVMQGITGINEKNRLKMTITQNGEFCANSVNYIIPPKDDDYDIYYILGILNSDLINWYFKKFSTNSNVNGYEVDNLPIILNFDFKDKLISLVKRNIGNDTKELMIEINDIVNKIYQITDTEKELISI